MYRTDKVYAKDSEVATMAQPKANAVILGMRPATAHEESADVGLKTLAKIGLSDVDNKRGYEMTVTGSGFNDGTTAGVYVLAGKARFEDTKWWKLARLRQDELVHGVRRQQQGFCFSLYADLDESAKTYTVGSDRRPRRLRCA